MNATESELLREQLLRALQGDQSHLDFEAALDDFPVEKAGGKPHNAPHSAWQLLEHLRMAQHDILEFSRNPKYVSPKWPEGYWPDSIAPASEQSWKSSVAMFQKDTAAMKALVASGELFQAIEGGDGQTLLREVLVLAAHNSYHLGQLVFLKKMLT
jgi:hypothetical protein